MRTLIYLAIIALAAAMLSMAAAGEPPVSAPTLPPATPDAKSIEKFTADLGHKEAAVRDAAQKRLVEIGLPSRPVLLAAAKSDDPEVRTRALAALKDLQEVTVKDLGKMPDPTQHLFISPSGERVAHFLHRDGKEILVCDGKEGPPADSILYVGPFSRDGARLGYQVRQGDQISILFVGEEDKPILAQGASRPVYSPDGKRVAYPVKGDAGDWCVICDGKEGAHYPEISPLCFSPDSQTLAGQGKDEKGKRFWFLNGKPLGLYDVINGAAFSPDSKHFAFAAGRGGKMVVVCDGKEGKAYDEVFYPLFSPDSKSLAYWTRTTDRQSILIIWNETEGGRITGEPRPAFSPDSRRLAWDNYRGDVYLCRQKGQEAVRISTGFDGSSQPVFSPDSRHIAYAVGNAFAASNTFKWNVMVDNQHLGDTYDADKVMFGDGPAGGGTMLVLDPPGFSADGRHVFFKGFKGPLVVKAPGRKAFMVIDGIARPEHDDLWIPDDFKNHPENLRYIVRDGDRLCLVETAWPETLSWPEAVEEHQEVNEKGRRLDPPRETESTAKMAEESRSPSLLQEAVTAPRSA